MGNMSVHAQKEVFPLHLISCHINTFDDMTTLLLSSDYSGSFYFLPFSTIVAVTAFGNSSQLPNIQKKEVTMIGTKLSWYD
jgi:hypothetical protein